MNKGEFTPLQIDLIKELANIGGGNAATSLSQLINKPTSMTVPTIEILNYNEVYKEIMAEETIVDAVLMKMLGDAEGLFLFVNSEESSQHLVEMMVDENIELTEQIYISAIKELVNIIVSSFLNAVSKMVDVSLISSVPVHVKDMFGAILSSVYIETGQYDENIMIIKNEFLYLGEKIESSLYFVPKPGVLKSLFQIIGV
ncbi:MAG TPA: chemotaxis protein CheC [Tissierellaceae bacterium]|nr:chemotaxis protein CheC [Tissierellaceae bacterium]